MVGWKEPLSGSSAARTSATDIPDMAELAGSSPLDLGADEDAPPAYGELHNQLNLSQAGFNADASITDDGRIRIHINQTSGRLADLLAPALVRSQALPSEKSSEPLPPAYIPPSLGGQPGQEPPPRLNVVIQIVGSRGDVQPFVALGKVLKDSYGHRVRVATHAVFRSFVEENGLEFFSIGGDPAELMAFMVKHPGLMPGFDAVKSGEISKRRRGIEQIVLGCWRSCVEAGDGLGPPPEPHQSGAPLSSFTSGDYALPGDAGGCKPFVADAIIANPPSFAHIHIAEKMGIPLHMMFTMPWTATKAFPHPLANIESSNAEVVMTNYVSYALVEMMTWQGLGDVINRFRTKVLDLEPLSLIWAPGLLTRLHIPTTYCWSPALIAKPNDWGREISISGFYFLDLATSYTPDPALAAFLDAGPPPVYIGFGSIVVDDPNKLTRMIFDAVTIAGVRALVSKGWGGLGADSVGIPDGVFMLGNCPHDWLFKKVSCVVHHGGAGTTAAGIKTGTPTVVVPFFGDQPFWGNMIAQAGAGPKPVRYKDLTAEILAEMITAALQPETQARAKELGERIRAEKGTDLGAKSFHDFLDYDKLRCSVAPSRTAVWRVRRTQVRLSGLAAAVLVQERLLQYTDLKLYRPHEYSTEQQPWDPITAVTSALVGDVSTMALAIQDIPGAWMKMAKRSPPGTPPPTTSTGEETATASTSHDGASTTTLAQTTDTSSQLLSPPSGGGDGRSTPGNVQPGMPSASPSHSRSGSKSPNPQKSSFGVEGALGASIESGKGVQRLVEASMKTPMNFCMGLAKGFRNAPRLYNDDTVRKQEKVTGLASGVMVASKEFGLGLYDGITGLVTQPLRGAEKDGAKGLISGFGKGIGGIVFKPAAGVWAIPAYLMKGVHAEIRSKFHKSVENYIIVSRILQGQDDLRRASLQEQNDIMMRFDGLKDEMKGFYRLKSKGKQAATPSAAAAAAPQAQEVDSSAGETNSSGPDAPPQTGFRHTRRLPIEERKRLYALKDTWKKNNKNKAAGAVSQTATASAPPPPPGSSEPEDEEMERAIRESVAQTSRGDRAEDSIIESQIRASVKEMRRIAGEQQGQGTQAAQQQPPALPERVAQKAAEAGMTDDITDEEFEALIAEAVRQSVVAQQQRGASPGAYDGDEDEEDEEFLRVLEESRQDDTAGAGRGYVDDEELKRAMEESERAHREHLARTSTERNEEEIVMEYVKKQSLAEEEFRQKAAKGKGHAAAASGGGGGGGGEDEDEDEDLRRAVEESLRMTGRTGGPSGSTS